MFNIGPQELLLILVLALLVVGPQRLPEIARSIGKGMRELRKAQDEVRKTISINLDEPSTATTRTPRRLPVEPDDQPDAATSMTDAGSGSEEEPIAPDAISGTDVAAAAASATAASTDDMSSGVSEISRTLGRTLAELRRAREEVQRSFRLDADVPRRSAPRSSGAAAVPADEPGSAERVEPSPSAGEPHSPSANDVDPGRDELDRPA